MKKLACISLSLLAPLAAFAEEASEAAVEATTSGIDFSTIGLGIAVQASALAIGLIGFSTAAAIGRNPSAKGDITGGILLPMVLAEGLGIIAVILAFVK